MIDIPFIPPLIPNPGKAASEIADSAVKDKKTTKEFESTSYGPPWNAMNGTGVTAGGTNLKPARRKYIIAVDPDVIPLGTKVKVTPNPFGYRGYFLADDTGGAIKGNRIDFYDWRGREKQLAWGRRKVKATWSSKKSATDIVTDPISGVVDTVTDGLGAIGAAAKLAVELFSLLFSPSTYFRAGKVILGNVMIALGLIGLLWVGLNAFTSNAPSNAVKSTAKDAALLATTKGLGKAGKVAK